MPRSPKTSEVHFETQLLDIVGILLGAVMFEELTTTVLAFVALPALTMTVLVQLRYIWDIA